MTIALALLIVVGCLAGSIVVHLATRRRRPPSDVLNHQALKRVVERHEKEQLGRD